MRCPHANRSCPLVESVLSHVISKLHIFRFSIGVFYVVYVTFPLSKRTIRFAPKLAHMGDWSTFARRQVWMLLTLLLGYSAYAQQLDEDGICVTTLSLNA